MQKYTFLLGLGLCLIMVISGCGPESRQEKADWYQSSETGDSLSEKELLTQINRQSNLFDLYEMKRAYIMGGGKSQTVVKMLEKRRDNLVEAKGLQEVIPGKVDFIDWNISREEEEGKYTISMYFVVKADLDRDWRLKLAAKVDEQHVDMLPPDRRKLKTLVYKLMPETSTWEPGEHKILSHTFDFKPIPYDISGVFFLWPEFTYGEVFEYGWFADPGNTGPDK